MTVLPDLDQLPVDLLESTSTLVWKSETRDGKPTKVPYQSRRPSERAAVDDPKTWSPFSVSYDCVADGKADGVGVVLTDADPLVGLDLDGCVNPTTHVITATALVIVRQISSYTEITPSRTGLRIFARGTLPPGGRVKRGMLPHTGIEIYDSHKYLTITGWHVPNTPISIEDRESELRAFHRQLFGAKPSTPPPAPSVDASDLTDGELLVKASSASNGAAFAALFGGDVSVHGGDQSAADLALCNLLAFWTGRSRDRMDRLFRQSGLMRPKWDERRRDTTYGAITIAKAIADCADVYTPAIEIQILDDVDPDRAEGESDRQADSAHTIVDSSWPVLAPAALFGLFGELVKTIAPQTEADPVGLLAQALVAWGNLIGRTPGMHVGADHHHLNENVLLAGDTSTARKGMSWSHVAAVMKDLDPEWTTTRVLAGLSSGEGLIFHVRDAREAREPIRERGKVTGYQTVIVDDGITDKRLLAFESEFAKTLRVSRRDGNTLSPVIRQAWDHGSLRVLTKTDPIAATGAHISLVVHISPRELRQELKTVDMASGFINRFLLLLVRRSQSLPEGGTVDSQAIDDLVQRFTIATSVARRTSTITRTEQAREHWRAIYPGLTRERSGLVGAICSRAPAHVLRLSCLYALADASAVIDVAHQQAAHALWTYAETSAMRIFGARTGHRLADYLLALLRATPGGLTRTEIRDKLGRNRHADEIDEALRLLEDYGLASKARVADGVGRPTTRWQARTGTT